MQLCKATTKKIIRAVSAILSALAETTAVTIEIIANTLIKGNATTTFFTTVPNKAFTTTPPMIGKSTILTIDQNIATGSTSMY